MMVESMGPAAKEIKISASALLVCVTSCMIQGSFPCLLNLSVLTENGNYHVPYLIGLLWGLSAVNNSDQCLADVDLEKIFCC